MRWFDALNHAMSACATAGFSTKNLSIAFYDNPTVELILAAAMLISSLHFGLIYATFLRKSNNIFRSEVVRTYMLIIAAATVFITVSLYGASIYTSLFEAFRHSYFQVVSLITTTGFSTAVTNLWTPLAIVLLIFVSIVCACAGSTSGGLKADRIVLAFKAVRARVLQQQHPNAVIRIKLNGQRQDSTVVDYAMLYIVAYLAMLFVGVTVFAICGFSLDGSIAASVASIGNVGMEVSNFGGFASAPSFVRFFSPVLMLFGRLEIFGLIQLFLLNTWK